MRKPQIEKCCAVCGVQFFVPNSRRDTAKCCGRACSDAKPRKRNEVNCRECGSLFPLKKSQELRNKAWGSFCSDDCNSKFRARVTVGEGNSNFRGRNFDHDGYRVFTPQASLKLGLGRMKVHHAVALTAVGLRKLPAGLHVHHRDCSRLNNVSPNLAFMTASDHKWVHQQFGVATLGAIASGDVDACRAAQWSDDPLRAQALLCIDVDAQGALMEYVRSKGFEPDLHRIAALKPVQCEFVVDGVAA